MKRVTVILVMILTALSASCEKQPREEVPEYSPPSFSGVVFALTGAGHVAVVNLADGSCGRIVLDRVPAALAKRPGSRVLDVLSMDGYIRKIDLSTGGSSEWIKAGDPPVCGAAYDRNGTLWFTDRGGRRLRAIPPDKTEAATMTSLPAGTCGISVDRDGRVILSSARTNTVSVFDAASGKVTATLPEAGNHIHRAFVSRRGGMLWIAEGNEYRNGKPYGVGFAKSDAHPGGINIYSPGEKLITDFVLVGGNVTDMQFADDGKHAFILSSQMPEYDEATLSALDTSTLRVVRNFALCKACHVWHGVDLPGNRAISTDFVLDESAGQLPSWVEAAR